MAVLLPVLADGKEDGRLAIGQGDPRSALVRLHVLLNVVLLRCKSNQPIPSFDPHPPDIPSLKLLGMLEEGIAKFA